MKNWTIGKLITVGYASILSITLLVGVFAVIRLTSIRSGAENIYHHGLPAIQLSDAIGFRGKQVAADTYRHICSENPAEIAQIDAAIQAARAANAKDTDALSALLTTGRQHELMVQFLGQRAQYGQVLDQVLALSRTGTNNAQSFRLARTQLDPACEAYIATLETVAKLCNEDGTRITGEIAASSRFSQTALAVGLIFAIALGASLAFAITRSTGRTLRKVASTLSDGADQVAAAATQVSAGSQSLAEGTSEQAASLEESSSSLEEMASMTRHSAEGALKAEALAKEACHAADTGTRNMQALAAAMESIKDSSNDIAKIIKTIDEIAFQTNILALNAAVEAARAGEAGMGFAVVADEVRNLAQRSAQAARETAEKIEGAIANTHQGVQLSAEVGKGLAEIVSKIHLVDELAAQAAASAKEQSQGISQVNLAVAQMDKVTQGNAANAEESAAAAEELSAQAESLKDAVAELLRLVGTRQVSALPETGSFARSMKTRAAAGNPVLSAPRTASSPIADAPALPWQSQAAMSKNDASPNASQPQPVAFQDM
jgi:methyl-accepting chemotaxis protein